VLAFQYGQAYQAHLLETGSLQPFVIESNAVVFSQCGYCATGR
jgi:hypothetical protein